jgi:Protein of unknown function (DUF2637)
VRPVPALLAPSGAHGTRAEEAGEAAKVTATVPHANGSAHPPAPLSVPFRGPEFIPVREALPGDSPQDKPADNQADIPQGESTPGADNSADNQADKTPLSRWRALSLRAIALLIAVASGASFAESYRGLFDWGHRHGLAGFWAAAFPLQVDVFIAVGELALFVAMVDRWKLRHRLGAWLCTLLGLAVSVAGNIGHIASPDIQSRATAAVPPVAAFAAMWVGLTVLKRVVGRDSETDSNPDNTVDTEPDKEPDTEAPKKPPQRRATPDRVADAVRRHPDWDDTRIAASCGVHPKTVKRRRAAIEAAAGNAP